MEKVTDTDIAVVAKKATNNAGIVAMIDMKIATPSGLASTTNSAFAFLGEKKFLVGSYRNPIVGLKFVIFRKARVFFSPLLGSLSHLGKILSAPLIVTSVLAGLAINLKAVLGIFARVVVGSRLAYLTSRAGLETGRKIEINPFGHLEFSCA